MDECWLVERGARKLQEILEGKAADGRIVPSTDEDKVGAAQRIRLVAYDEENTDLIVKAGDTIKELIQMAMFDSEECKEAAASALAVLVYHDEARKKIVEEDGIRALISIITGGAKTANAKREACFGLGNLCSGRANAENRKKVMEGGAMRPLIELVRSGETELCRQHAAGALTQLAGDCEIRARLWEAGALEPLVDLFFTADTLAKNWANVAMEALCCKKVDAPARGYPGAYSVLRDEKKWQEVEKAKGA